MNEHTPPHPDLPSWYGTAEDRQEWVNALFDRNAKSYDKVGGTISLGTGNAYRRAALKRAGVRPGMRVLDVATGTGLVAAAGLQLGVEPGDIAGIDPSLGMLRENRRHRMIPLARGVGERLPFRDDAFDFVTMGYALRHVPDLVTAFREYRRILRDGGKVLLLEITKPQSKIGRVTSRLWFKNLAPQIARLRTRSKDAREMLRYYWETIEHCVPPGAILQALHDAGFQEVGRETQLGIFSEYGGRK